MVFWDKVCQVNEVCESANDRGMNMAIRKVGEEIVIVEAKTEQHNVQNVADALRKLLGGGM